MTKRKWVVVVLLATWLAGPSGARAELVPTSFILDHAAARQARAQVMAALARTEVQAQMQALGVSAAEARERVASLSDSEIEALAGRLHEEPAGGNAVGVIIGAAVFIFIVLLITDILGVTDVFPFVKPVR